MTEVEQLVSEVLRCVAADRKSAGSTEFWESIYTTDKVETIASRISEEDREAINEIVDLTLAMLDADYMAQSGHTEWGVWENQETGEIVSAGTSMGRGWDEIAKFDGRTFDIRDLDYDFQDLEMPQLYDEFFAWYTGELQQDFAEKIQDILDSRNNVEPMDLGR